MESQGIIIGLIIGLLIGAGAVYAVFPRPDVSGFEDRIEELESQVTDLQSQLTDLQEDYAEARSRALASELQLALEDVVESPDATFPGALLYVSNPELGTWTLAAGLGDIETASPMRPDDKFRVGSIMKPFISVVTLQLVEEGRFSLDDLLPDVLPEAIVARLPDADKITVRMLLSHRSGLAEYVPALYAELAANPAKVYDVEEFLDIAAAQEPFFAPGEGYTYSNTNFNLLELVIEEATGRPWRVEVRERVIEPLNLENTLLPEPGDSSIPGNHARGYIAGEMVGMPGQLLDYTEVDGSFVGGPGGASLVSTTSDLARFMDALMAGELFQNEETLAEMVAFNDAPDMGGQVGYGLGLMKAVLPGGNEFFGHAGGAPGYFSTVGYIPVGDITLVMSSNVFPPDEYSITWYISFLETLISELSATEGQ